MHFALLGSLVKETMFTSANVKAYMYEAGDPEGRHDMTIYSLGDALGRPTELLKEGRVPAKTKSKCEAETFEEPMQKQRKRVRCKQPEGPGAAAAKTKTKTATTTRMHDQDSVDDDNEDNEDDENSKSDREWDDDEDTRSGESSASSSSIPPPPAPIAKAKKYTGPDAFNHAKLGIVMSPGGCRGGYTPPGAAAAVEDLPEGGLSPPAAAALTPAIIYCTLFEN